MPFHRSVVRRVAYYAGLLISLSLVGCSSSSLRSLIETPTQLTQVEITLPDLRPQEPLPVDQADALMAVLVDAMNQNQPEVIAPYVWESANRPEQVAAAIANFKTLFNQSPITSLTRTLTELPPNAQFAGQPEQRYRYEIATDTGMTQIIILQQQSGSIRVLHPFFHYSYFAKQQIDRLIESVQTNDADGLARALSPDDIDYPPNLATEAIATYRRVFDPDTMQGQFVGWEEERDRFVYRITGTKAGQTVEHSVVVIYGDGLVGVQDDLIPSIP